MLTSRAIFTRGGKVSIPSRVELNAWDRQGGGGREQYDALCAICGESLDAMYFKQKRKGGWFPSWCLPPTLGGNRKASNCICLCPECYEKRMQDSSKVIAIDVLPHYRVIR